MNALKIPDDLAEQASRIPGLSERVTRFIKLEVAQFEQRQKRFHPETLALVARAQEKAAAKRDAGFDSDEVKQSFSRHLETMLENQGNS
ncbi:MAG: hypothetical protein NTV46_21965 [Verrucomicrobia bacterium]|nr:hypothetical protein [Verrucomicrobiota bacterium]